MICPKCGQEYEGQSCPRCSKPDVVVNNADYLRRKKAYEERKQAEEESASSASIQTSQGLQPEEILEKIKSKRPVLSRAGKRRTEKNSSGIPELTGGPDVKTQEAEAGTGAFKVRRKHRKHWGKLIIAAVLIAALAAGGTGIYKLATRKNYVLYMSYNDRIYNVAGLDTKLVCEMPQAVFEADNSTFYTPDFPREINQRQVVQQMASTGGDYFAAVTFDETSSKYALYLWNEKDCIKIVEGPKEKNIKFISEKGCVVYTDTEVVNDEGAVGGVELYIYEVLKGSSIFEEGFLTALDENLRSVYIYSEKSTVIFLGNDNALYTYLFGKEKKGAKQLISDEVRNIYAMSGEADGLYTYQAQTVNLSDSADGFIYRDSVSGNCYYHTVSEKQTDDDVPIGKATGSGMEFIYEKNSGIYLISTAGLWYAPLEKDQVPVYTEIDKMGNALNVVYIASEGKVLFVNADQNLLRVRKGAVKTVAENVSDGSLSQVVNTQQGITYIRDGIQYYRSSSSASEVRMTEVGAEAVTKYTLFYKNRLYFYDSSGELYSCTVKGKDRSLVGEVEQFWLGTQLN